MSYKPDKRNRLFKQIQSIKEFSLLKDFELKTFVRNEANDLGLSMECIEKLIEKIGNDQYRLSSEIDKLRYWKNVNNKNIDLNVIEDVCFGQVDDDVFKLLDLILENRDGAVRFLLSLERKGMDWNELNGSFMRGLRNYILVLNYTECGIKDPKIIAADLKQNPWVIGNLVKKLPSLQKNKQLILNLFSKLVDIDADIKNGVIQPEMYYHTIKVVLLGN